LNINFLPAGQQVNEPFTFFAYFAVKSFSML
jgi:hypothetical protein